MALNGPMMNEMTPGERADAAMAKVEAGLEVSGGPVTPNEASEGNLRPHAPDPEAPSGPQATPRAESAVKRERGCCCIVS